jgi:hypothetical protein
MLYYVPLESIPSRYTMQWAAPRTGWLERNWIKAGVEYKRIDPLVDVAAYDELRKADASVIKTGSVVDGVGRSLQTFEQVKHLLILAEQGKVTSEDVIFFDDFWTPGLEALPYAFHLLGIKPKMYAFLHAQSVDEFDFTHPMREWMRPIETGFAAALDGIFVCCPTLKDLVCFGGIAPRDKVHVTGHPFSSEEVMERMPADYRMQMSGRDANGKPFTNSAGQALAFPRKNQVVWSSRWDSEKNPKFFVNVMLETIQDTFSDARFVVCTSAPQLRSNNPSLVTLLKAAIAKYPTRIELREGLTKEEYYAILCESKVQFNCANQDFVAITLLEASVAGCYPIYPYFRSFPETFLWNKGHEFMYGHLDQGHAVGAICDVVHDDTLWTADKIKGRSWIHRRFDDSWIRMLRLLTPKMHSPNWGLAYSDPFDPISATNVYGAPI